MAALFVCMTASAAKEIYIPRVWNYNSSTGEYTENGVSYSMSRKRESDNFVVFWSSEYGNTAPDALASSDFYYVDINDLLAKAENFYSLYAVTLKFADPATSNTMSRYKCMILLIHSSEWMAYGGGYDFVIPALWVNPATCKPVGHTIAHEVGHSFHYMCFAESNNHQGSNTDNTGFHLACGNGQAIWEQTAQWQAAMAYPQSMFTESYPLFGNNANYAFSHEWMRYQSYWFHYYLCQYYNDITTVAQVWKQPMKNQSNGSATDFCQAYIALKGLSAAQFYERYFDYAMHCATFDFDRAANYRNDYIGKFDYRAVQLAPNKYQVAYSSAPQSTGFNVIELNVPASGTSVTTNLTALTHGCALANSDPGQYNNGEPNSLVSANVSNYNSAGNASYRGFRMGYVFLKNDGTRVYYNDNTVHCTGTAEKTESITYAVPANTSRMFLVIAPALTTYVRHPWDENILNDDQWPYQFELVNTSAKSVTPYFNEPEFTKQIDGREISDVTLTYNVVLPPTSGYDGATVNFSGSGLNALCTAFQMEGDNIFNNAVAYSANQANGTIMNYAVNSSMQLQTSGNTANGDFGHWFNASGTVTSWGNNSVAFIEFTKPTKTASVGQMPDANSNGTTRTIREALVYKNSSGQTATAYMIFNITFDSSITAGYSYLADIDYVEPSTASDATATAYRATSVQNITLAMKQGNTATSDAINSATLASALNNLTESYLTNARYFKGYYDPLSSATSGDYVYYYALDGAPAATASRQGTVTYYQTASVINDSEFNGQYVHYYNAAGGCVASTSAANAVLKVAYNMAEKKFTVKAEENCPVGTYTVWMGMARKNNSSRIYVGYFPITVTVSEYSETDNWPDITTLPEDYSKWFFIFKDHKKNLYLTMRDGVHQADNNFVSNTMFYSGQDADKPEVNKNSLWTLDSHVYDNEEYQIITSPMFRNYMLQTEWEAAQFCRTHDNGGGDLNWGRTKFTYQNGYWTVNNGTYPESGYLGPWDEQFVDGAEVALNKLNDFIGHFDVSAILRGEYVKTYEDLTAVNYNNPLDITYCLENEGGDRWSTIGWKNTGAGWAAQTNDALNGKVGGRYLESYNGAGLEQTDFYQEIYGLPEGYYRFSAIANCSADCYLYANGEQIAMPTNNQGARTFVIVQVTGSEGYLKVGAKTGDNPGAWIAFDEAQLEYLGTSLPSAFVGNPTTTIPDGGYFQSLTTFDFAFNEAASDTYTFTLLNSAANVTLAKNGLSIAFGTVALNNKTLSASFNGVTLEPNTEYTLTLPAGVVGYAGVIANEEVTLTLHTPVVWDGTYYLYNTYSHRYISRGGEWATSATMDDWGLALLLITDTEGYTSFKFFDNQNRYLYNDGYCYGDGGVDNRLRFTIEQVTGGYKFLNKSNNRYLAEWAWRAVADAAEGENLWETSNIWTLESTADHVANYTRNADAQAATAATAAALTGITTQAELESAITTGYQAVTVDEQYNGDTGAEKYQVYAETQASLQEAEYEKYTLTNMKPGLYRLTVDAFQRAAWFDWVYDNDGARGAMYAYVNGAKTQLKSVTEYSSTTAFSQDWSRDGNHYVNGIPAAYPVLNEGHYSNVVYVYVPADEGSETATITYGINNPNRLGNGVSEGTWCCYKNFKLEYLEPYVTLSELDETAPVAANGVNVRFLRSMIAKDKVESNNAWNTICFPFSLNAQQIQDIFGEGTVVKELTGVNPTNEYHFLTFTDVNAIDANKPYIMQIQSGNEKSEYIIENIDITPSENLTQTVGGVDFVGNYIYPKVMDNTRGTDYYILNDVFKSSTGRTKIKGFRAYFHVPEGSGIKALGFDFDGDATSIETIEGLNVNFPADIYNVGGQLVRKNADNIDNLPAGIYFVNGKKVIKR